MSLATCLLVKLLLLAHMFGGIAVWNGGDDPAHTLMIRQDCSWHLGAPGPTGYDLCTVDR